MKLKTFGRVQTLPGQYDPFLFHCPPTWHGRGMPQVTVYESSAPTCQGEGVRETPSKLHKDLKNVGTLTTADMNLRLAGQVAELTPSLLTAVESGPGRWRH